MIVAQNLVQLKILAIRNRVDSDDVSSLRSYDCRANFTDNPLFLQMSIAVIFNSPCMVYLKILKTKSTENMSEWKIPTKNFRLGYVN